ncbi:Undecaprenyl-diphosphatase [Candidatus Desulfarcum epimagneticum]|uniref:Undecaprenyl-diphosphatase n=1 Tax=uncultured Desulfobacteraceae bacterium TaxID=218296 RepID=A0A484HEQ3_9BACT|nr:Undecaprenyl-diphosphatase [uncultured Desulfobacteraceae bacterium]
MDMLKAVALGALQGATEFLPVSSSGHLVIFQTIFGLESPEVFFDVCLHLGTLAAVVFFFRKDLWGMAASFFTLLWLAARKKTPLSKIWEDEKARMALLVALGSVPTAAIGLLLNPVVERLFSSIFIAGAMLAVTGCLLWFSGKVDGKTPRRRELSVKDALVMGVVQGLAIVPGISRSGSTIAAGLFLGLDGEKAARYSFLLSVPAVIGAGILSAGSFGPDSAFSVSAVLWGTAAAAGVGYAALAFLMRLVRRGRLSAFAPYCWLMALASMALGFSG